MANLARLPLLLIWLLLGGQGRVGAAEVTVFAAASLSDALSEIGRSHEAATGDRVRFNFGASSTLARQIREGAPADVFFSADEAKMDELTARGLVVVETRRTLLSNTLVLVVPLSPRVEVSSPGDLASEAVKRVALAEPSTVPAGIYAREYLETLGLWAQVSAKTVSTANVRAALAAVESGNVDAGFVYKTDAALSTRLRVAYEVPHSQGPRISYPVAVLKDAREREAALSWVQYLASDEARVIFEKYGFLIVRPQLQ